MSATPMIEVFDLERTYSTGELSVYALRGVTFKVARGELIAIMGHSGSGKSTAMNILGCLDRPTGGRYLLDGEDVSALSADDLADLRSASLGFVFQGFNLLGRTSAVDNVELPLMYGPWVPAKKRRARALECLDMVGLSDRASHMPAQLSGGEQQRVAIARALVNHPLLLLADEPTGNLDTQRSEEILALFQRLNVENGITVAMVTHEPDIAACCRRVLTFQDGRLLSDKPVETRWLEGVVPCAT